MEAKKNMSEPFSLLMEATGYVLGGMFLFDASVRLYVGVGAGVGKVFGGVFMAFGFFLVISSFFDGLRRWRELSRWRDKINYALFGGLFLITLTDLIVVALESTEYLFFRVAVAMAFFLIVIAAIVFQSFRDRRGSR